MKISIYAPYAKERLELKSVLKQRVNIQFCIMDKSSASRKPSGFHGEISPAKS
jgi:hypothetical protein